MCVKYHINILSEHNAICMGGFVAWATTMCVCVFDYVQCVLSAFETVLLFFCLTCRAAAAASAGLLFHVCILYSHC